VTIPFVLPETGENHQVRLEIHDLLGRRVTTLAQGVYPSGFYQATWNVDEQPVGNGLYLYRLIVNEDRNKVFTGKVFVRN